MAAEREPHPSPLITPHTIDHPEAFHANISKTTIIQRLHTAILEGCHWYLALLAAIRDWELPEERFHGRFWTYLIDGEALDLLLLAERLLAEIPDLIPQEATAALLFEGIPPLTLSSDEFRKHVGLEKYRCILNFFYGVTVEEALLYLLEEELRRRTVTGRLSSQAMDTIYIDLYGSPLADLLSDFARHHHLSQQETGSLDVNELKAFTYFLFKRRIVYCLPARVASDTKRGLAELRRQYVASGRNAIIPGRLDGASSEDLP